MFAGPVSACRNTTVGAKLFNLQMDNDGEHSFVALEHVLGAVGPQTRVLVLYRRDMLQTYVSLELAFLTDNWFSTTTPHPPSAFEFDLDHFEDYIRRERARWQTQLRTLESLPRSQVLVVEYEQLASRLDDTMTAIFRFIGVPQRSMAWLKARGLRMSVKQNTQSNREVVSNYDDVDFDALARRADCVLPDEWFAKLPVLKLDDEPRG